tara:strand:+ start:25447 stop:26118 length:672 start_codon:yes stop_codon:yes gene_type:complete
MVSNYSIIWDAGGVIYDFDVSITNRRLAVDCGRTPEEVSAFLFGSSAESREFNGGAVEAYNLGQIDSVKFYGKVRKDLGVKMDYNEFIDAWNNIFTLNTIVAEFIRRVRNSRRHRQAILSSTNPLHWGGMMNLFDLENLLEKDDIILTCDQDIRAKKPTKKLWDASLARLGGEKEEFIYVDDVQKYVSGSEALGIKSIHVDITQPNFQERCVADVSKVLGIEL